MAKYVVRRTQEVEVDTDDWRLRPDETEWTEEMILDLAEKNYDWGDNTDCYEIVHSNARTDPTWCDSCGGPCRDEEADHEQGH